MKVRKIKKLLKSYKWHLEVSLRDESEEDGNIIIFYPGEELQFTKFGITKMWNGVPYEHIPYWRIKWSRNIDLSHLDK